MSVSYYTENISHASCSVHGYRLTCCCKSFNFKHVDHIPDAGKMVLRINDTRYDTFLNMLTLHPNGQWCKKIRGKQYYFGTDKAKAVEKYLKQKDYLHAGISPPKDRLTVREIANLYLDAKKSKVAAGEMQMISWTSTRQVLSGLVESLGSREAESLAPADFREFKAGIGGKPYTVANIVTRCRAMFNWAYKQRLISSVPFYGGEFDRPSAKSMRGSKASGLMFTCDEIRSLVSSSSSQLRAAILLGINCAYGNHDIGKLELTAIDGEWINYPRPKTGVDRRCWLWPETRDALKVCNQTGLAFTSEKGNPIVGGTRRDMLGRHFSKLLDILGIKRERRNFYSLRRTFRTVADEIPDSHAIDVIMGHADNSIGRAYTQRISDDRIKTVSNHVREWLYVR